MIRSTQSPGRENGGAAVMEKAPERVRKPSPRYKVLLHNDPVNTMEYVVSTLRQVVPSLSEQDAIAVMLEAHNTGVGLVIKGYDRMSPKSAHLLKQEDEREATPEIDENDVKTNYTQNVFNSIMSFFTHDDVD